jgi:glycosyltransferase involved in cell wall biosynthesis
MIRDSSWIAYVGPILFPWGHPGSRRVLGIASSLAAAGHDVVVASGEVGPSAVTTIEDLDGAGSVSYIGLGELPLPSDDLLTKSVQILVRWGRKTVEWLDNQPTTPSHIVVYGGGAQYMYQLRRWCLRRKVPLIVDVVEWYSSRQLVGGFFGPVHIGAKFALRYQYPRCDGIIAISTFLERHFVSKGCRVVRVPPTLDVRNMSLVRRDVSTHARKLTLIYSGTPGKKDLLANIIRGVSLADRNHDRLELIVVGPSSQQVTDLLGGEALPRNVRVLGRIPQREVSALLQQADFSILLRRPERFAQAGFPTKFCESMANGTPVIANLTSDLGSYLSHHSEGMICDDFSAEALSESLRRALLLCDDELAMMRQAARHRALNSFDFRNYADPLSRFFEAIRV